MLTRRIVAATLVAGSALLPVAGCTGVTAGRCVDWVSMPSAGERAEASDLVVDARVETTARTFEDAGRYVVHRAAVDKVVRGDVDAGVIDVISTSDQCTTSSEPVEYLDGDVLEHDGTYRLYLVETAEDSGVWRLVVPGAADRLD